MDDIVIILILILLNGVFSMSEIALISARKSRLAADAKNGSRGARAALKLAEEPDRFLSTIQIGITLIGILTGLYSGAALAEDVGRMLQNWGMAPRTAHNVGQTAIVAVVTYLSIVAGELVPKRIGLAVANPVARAIARPMHLLSVIAMPAVWLLSASTNVYDALDRMKNRSVHFALVCDEFGEMTGVMTPGDILDGLVGAMPQQTVMPPSPLPAAIMNGAWMPRCNSMIF